MDDHYTVLKAPPARDGDSSLDSQVAATPTIPIGSPTALEPSSVPPLLVTISSVDDCSTEMEFGFPGSSPAPVLDVPLGHVGG